jgi:predicted signal transduction protein with EAL and GGDEF domain
MIVDILTSSAEMKDTSDSAMDSEKLRRRRVYTLIGHEETANGDGELFNATHATRISVINFVGMQLGTNQFEGNFKVPK